MLGRAGSGKTHTCLAQVVAALAREPEGPPLMLLVPEQATFQTEQALLHMLAERTGRRAFMRAQVLSFQRLAWRLFQLTGGERPMVGDLGQRMILRALLQAEGDGLQLFSRVADQPGFIARLAATLSELKAQEIGFQALAEARQALAGDELPAAGVLLGAKLGDLVRIGTAYENYLSDTLADPAATLSRAAQLLPGSGLVERAQIWVDGFAGFNRQELTVLGLLMGQAQDVHVALCLDPGDVEAGERPNETMLFHPTLATYGTLLELAETHQVLVGEPILLPADCGDAGGRLPRFQCPELAHVERQLFTFPGARYAQEPHAITMLEAGDPRQEVEAAAGAIRRLARTEGYRYRELGVMVRDLDRYGEILRHTFARYDIPVFIDRRRPVPHHPLLELLRSALETLSRDWPYAPVFRFLKSDLLPVSRDEVDRLENYVLEFGIRGDRWYDHGPWRFRRRYSLGEDVTPAPQQQRRLQRQWRQIHEIRQRAAAPLVRLQQRLASEDEALGVETVSQALYDVLLDELDVRQQLERWSEEAEAAGDLQEAQEHLQVWNGVVEILDEMVAALPDVSVTLEQYLTVLESGFEALQVGLIPPGLDQVVVGTVERSRQPSVRAAFILGATEDAFPRRQSEDVIFTDSERERLAQHGLELADTAGLRMLHEQYLTYIAVTRARERLWISYPLADEEGKREQPAFLVRRLQVLLPQLQVVQAAAADGPAAVETTGQLVDGLVQALRQGRDGGTVPEAWFAAYQWIVSREPYRRQAAPLLAALDYDNRVSSLPAAQVEALYGQRLAASPSRLETFASCPFQHFARYGLGLAPRPVQQVEAPELGLFYHAALSRFTEILAGRSAAWDALTRPQVQELLDRVMEELVPRLQSEILTSSARYRFVTQRIRQVLETAIMTLVEHARQGAFRPAAVEVAFADAPHARLPALRYRLQGAGQRELVVEGRIDRVDVAESADGERFIRVVDFKSSQRRLILHELYHGLALQLGLYLLAAWHGVQELTGWSAADVKPAGLLYLPVHDPLLSTDGPLSADEAAAGRRRQLRADGWILDDDAAVAAMDAAGSGQLVPVNLKKDGRPDARSRVAARHELEALLRHLEGQVQELGSQLWAGRIEAAPYRLRQHSPCQYCDFRPFCQFDPLVPGNQYRRLAPLADDEVLARVRRESQQGGETDDD